MSIIIPKNNNLHFSVGELLLLLFIHKTLRGGCLASSRKSNALHPKSGDYLNSEVVLFKTEKKRKEFSQESHNIERRTIMNASVAIQVLPKVDTDEEVIRIVDEVIDYIKSTGLSYYVGPCETSIEGDYDELMDIIKECQKVAVKAGAESVSAYVKITYRPEGEVLTIEKKVTKHHE